jgi:hypothetical protein
MGKPNCLQCKHFFITFNPKTPKGCRKFGIQCKNLPSEIVFMAGHGECQGFEQKKRPDEKNKGLDLNRKELW